MKPERHAALLGAKLEALARESHGAAIMTAPLGSAVSGVDADSATPTAYVLVEDLTAASLGAVLLHASREEVDALVLYADQGASTGARLAEGFQPAGVPVPVPVPGVPVQSIEVREVDGPGSRVARPAPMPVILPGPADVEPMIDQLAAAGLEPILEQGEWRGELSGLEVARIVRWPLETGGDGELHVEAGVGRFDRDAVAAMHQGGSPGEALDRAIAIVSAHRYIGAPIHPLSLLARSRWMRSLAVSTPEVVGAAHLRPVETAISAGSVREECPAAALGRDGDGTPVLVVFGTGAALDLLPVGTDARELHLPGGTLRLAVSPRDHMRSTDELVAWAGATGHGPVEVIEMEPPWTT